MARTLTWRDPSKATYQVIAQSGTLYTSVPPGTPIVVSDVDALSLLASGVFVEAGDVTPAYATANRPTQNLQVGMCVLDTTLNKPVWWNGSVWKDATGATV